MAFLTDDTPAHEFGSMKDPLPSKTTMLLCQPLLTLQAKACGNWLLGTSFGVRYELVLSILPDCQTFHLQGPRIVVLSLSPSTVLIQHVANRLDSQPVLLHRSPRSPSVATSLLSIDMLPLVTAFRSASSSCRSVGLLLHWRRQTVAL